MKSIGFKLWAGIIMLVLVVIILLWFFQIVFLESFYYDMRISSIKDKGINILKFLANDDKRNFENQAEEFAFNNNLSIELIGLDKNTIYESTVASNAQNQMMRNYARNDAFNDVINGQEVTIPMEHPRFGNRFMLLGIPYEKNGKIIGAFFMNVPLAPVEDTVMILKKQLLYITIILLIASIIISSIMAKIFTRPILEIKRVSEKIAAGDFSDRIKNKSSDEIGSLADTINLMGKELSKIDQLRKDLIANVSHELRTPLSIIRGYAETIKDVTGDIKIKRDKQLDIIIEEAERLSKIVDDMLNLSQIQSGYLKIKQQKFLINKTIERVVKRYDILVEKLGVKLCLEIGSDVDVYADESRIEQVLYNLINNAFNHTKESGKITIRIIDEKNYKKGMVRIEVIDTGSGIHNDDIKHVWDKYYKSDKTNRKKVVGTGLGLAIVKSILQAHNASFGVDSKVNTGTNFWFELGIAKK